jgi:hypothetical protein
VRFWKSSVKVVRHRNGNSFCDKPVEKVRPSRQPRSSFRETEERPVCPRFCAVSFRFFLSGFFVGFLRLFPGFSCDNHFGMSWFLNSIPYILAGFTILLAFFQLRKEWDEYSEHKFLRRAVLAVLIVVACLTFVSLHFDNKAKDEERSKSEADIRELKAKAQSANDAQESNTKLFVDKFGSMSKEIGDLKTEVKTEALQKKLATVQEELRKTQKAMVRPKAELSFTFVPFNNPPADSSASGGPTTHVDLPINLDGTVHVEGGALNMTSVDAADVDLDIQICDGCKYAKEPPNAVKIEGVSDTVRLIKVPHVQGMQFFVPITFDIIPPPNIKGFGVGFTYRCSTCVVTRKLSLGMVHILGR